jgi:hypothetical protein
VQVGQITVDGVAVGVVTQSEGEMDTFTPNLDGYTPQGRASETPQGIEPPHQGHGHHGGGGTGSHVHQAPVHQQHAPAKRHWPGEHHGQTYAPSSGGSPFSQGSSETDRAIQEAARAHGLDPNFMRSVASIESGMNPSSNANRSTQYKGLYQIGHDEWRRVGAGGNIYSAKENALGAARLFEANRDQFKEHFGRDPTETELYMMHQQGLGFYTRGAMTNISGNPYPGMRGPQTHATFEAGWGREIARRKAGFARTNPATAVAPDVTATSPL